MKMAFVVHNEYFTPRVMNLLQALGIDYYTRWVNAQGKGHGTDPNIGSGKFASTNAVMMIAFHDESVLESLMERVVAFNEEIPRANDRIRVFQLPLERIV